MDRLQQLQAWAGARLGTDAPALVPASADASFRRYFRIALAGRTVIAMDAPPPQEDCRPFVKVAQLFRDAGVNVPEVLAADLEHGFLLLTDLGSTTFLAALPDAAADPLYMGAFAALVRIQAASRPGVLPEYDEALLLREMRLFPEWYVARQIGRAHV